MRPGYHIRLARRDDITAMVALRTEAERWLARSGVRQWTPDYADYGREALRSAVAAQVAWVVVDPAGEVAATASLSECESDRAFWRRVPGVDVSDALYLGKMIVARRHAGRGLGDCILDWAAARAGAAHKRWLRLDARRDNKRLHAYYLDRGFVHVGTLQPLPGQRTESGWLAQRPSVCASVESPFIGEL